MSGTQMPRTLFLVIAVAAVVQCVHDFPLLPDRMASHFGPSGMPNGWMSKSQFLTVYAMVLLPALAVEFWLARRIAKTPGARMNLPNKDYWMAPERRASTLAYFESFFCLVRLRVPAIAGFRDGSGHARQPGRVATASDGPHRHGALGVRSVQPRSDCYDVPSIFNAAMNSYMSRTTMPTL